MTWVGFCTSCYISCSWQNWVGRIIRDIVGVGVNVGVGVGVGAEWR